MGERLWGSNEALSRDLLPLSGPPSWSSRAGLRAGIGVDGNRSDDALSREISRRNAARTIRESEISPLRFASVEMTEVGAGRLF